MSSKVRMGGCRCLNSRKLNLILDARWFTREEILAILEHKDGTSFTRSDYKQMASMDERDNVKSVGDPPGGVQDGDSRNAAFRIPPRTTIAGVLISDWAFGNVPAEIGLKGRM